MLRRIVPYLDQLLVSAGSFLTIAICAHKLSLAEQGKLGYVFALYMATIVIQVTLIHNWATVQFPRRNNQLRYYQSLVLMNAILAPLSAGLLCAAMYWLALSANWVATPRMLLLLFVYLLLQQAGDFLRKSAYYAHQQEKALWVSTLMYPLRIILLLIVSVSSVDDVLLIMIASCLLPLLWFVRLPGGNKAFSFRQLTRIGSRHLMGSSQLGLIAVITWAWNYIPVFFLGALQGAAAVALLVSLRSLSNLFNVVLEVLETSFASKLAKAYAAASNWQAVIRKEYISGFLLWLSGLVFLVFMHKAIVPIALGKKFIEYDHLIILFWVAQGFTFLFRIEGVQLRTMGMAELITWGNLLALIFMSATGWIVVRKYGVNGATCLYILAPLIIFFGQWAGYWLKRRAALNVG